RRTVLFRSFMPARRSFSIIGTDRDAGPKVHTIFVFGLFTVQTFTPLLLFSIAIAENFSFFFNKKRKLKEETFVED
ncbi:hypothetical protein, partial [Klebsiella pneumoniae]|uniref:hypothetical protein n=1 Tax=Klebsiella pneumoniae TaxID=573 RepID=UPI0024DE37D2